MNESQEILLIDNWDNVELLVTLCTFCDFKMLHEEANILVTNRMESKRQIRMGIK